VPEKEEDDDMIDEDRKLSNRARGSRCRLPRLGLGSLIALATACGVTDPDESVGSDEAPLYGLGSLGTRWTNGEVPICFGNFQAGDERYDKIRWILTETWGAVANIRFTGFGACPATGNRVSITFVTDSRGSADSVGEGVRNVVLRGQDDTFLASEVGSGSGGNLSRFRYQVIHEIGHVLGFVHEQERPDNWTYFPNGTPNQSLGCPADFNDLGNWLPETGGTYFTTYDAQSVMGYCSREPGTTSPFVQNLSAGDIAGVRAANAYGANPVRRSTLRNVLWRHAIDGRISQWHMNGGTFAWTNLPATATIGTVPDPAWRIQGNGDFDGDGIGDILWRATDGQVAIWYLNSGSIRAQAYPGKPGNEWVIRGTGDFNADGKSDILWRATNGQVAIWWNGVPASAYYPGGPVGNEWTIERVGDFDGDRFSDILWRANNGQLAIWGRAAPDRAWYPGLVGFDWLIQGVGDFDADGASDILWRANNGQVAIWGRAASNRAWFPGGPIGAEWAIKGVGDFDSDGRSDILWRASTNGQVAIWWRGDPGGASYPGGTGGNVWSIEGVMAGLTY
jgi:hypothetical protein